MSTRPQALQDANAQTKYLWLWLLVALFFEYARPAGFLPGGAVLGKLNSLIPLVLVLVVAFNKQLRPSAEIFADPMSKWILIYLGLIAFGMAHAEVTMYSFGVTTLALGYVLLFFMIVRICTTLDRVRGVFAVLVVAHLFLLVMNPAAVLNPNERNYIKGGTFLGDGNDFALSICILLPMAIELALTARTRLGRWGWWGALALLALALIAGSSRGGTLGMVAVAGYLWLRSNRKGLLLVIMALAAAVLLLYAGDIYFQRMGGITHYEDDGSAMGRIMAWKSSLRMVADHPLIGVGSGHFPVSFGTKYRPAGHENIAWLTAHSSYFLVLGELGLPGLFVLLRLIIGNMRANTRLRKELESKTAGTAGRVPDEATRTLYMLCASMLGFAIPGAFLSAAYYPHIFILSGLMVAARCIARSMAAAPAAEAVPDTRVAAGRRVFSGSVASAMRRRIRRGS